MQKKEAEMLPFFLEYFLDNY